MSNVERADELVQSWAKRTWKIIMSAIETNTETAILSRVIVPDRGDLSLDAANSILKLELDPADLEQMRQLAAKHQAGELSDEEQQELERYRRVGRLLDPMRSKARQSLACRPESRSTGRRR